MSTFSNLSSSLVSATIENTLALASINLDFSLVKLEAPKEFTPLGLALNQKRRHNAEDGTQHKTARRLGALFEQLAPNTPKLIRAYGLRASEVIQTPSINPQGSSAEGPFRSYVGADATSIWAAATSGPASISVLLLACMLARKFADLKISVAIWVELVAERQKEIERAMNNNEVISASSMIAARQTITRDDLAIFDASVRSWLCSADRALVKQQTQMMLILKSIPAFVSVGPSTYKKVIGAWQTAMVGLEGLLEGMPHEIHDGAILLALSAWHLYPDLIVLSVETKHVTFKESLFPRGAVVTVGLSSPADELDKGIRWSLALSHLQYYGDSVQVEAHEDNSRVTFQQLCVAAMGAVFASWGIKQSDLKNAARFIFSLKQACGRELDVSKSFGLPEHGFQKSSLPWLELLSRAASDLLMSSGSEYDICLALCKHGMRRGNRFLEDLERCPKPYFGLCDRHLLSALSQNSDIECGVQYLRELALHKEHARRQLLIVYVTSLEGQKTFVFATASPHQYLNEKQDLPGGSKWSSRHVRWVLTFRGPRNLFHQSLYRDEITNLKKRIEARGENVYLIDQENHEKIKFGESYLEWTNPPIALKTQNVESSCHSSTVSKGCDCFEEMAVGTVLRYKRIYGDPETLSIYLPTKNQSIIVSFDRAFPIRHEVVGLETTIKTLENGSINPFCLSLYLSSLSRMAGAALIEQNRRKGNFLFGVPNSGPVSEALPAASCIIPLLAEENILSAEFLLSFRLLNYGSELYSQFPTHTIPLHILYESLWQSGWIPAPTHKNIEVFACLTVFETGRFPVINIGEFPKVMALASGDSIFVDTALVSDPGQGKRDSPVRHIVGNIGHPGVSLMVSPSGLRCQKLSDDFRAVQHAQYNYERENSFRGTTLHLAFTNWKAPLVAGYQQGFVDRDAHILEAVISVRDHGRWVADIDPIDAGPFNIVVPADHEACCPDCRYCGDRPKEESSQSIIEPEESSNHSDDDFDVDFAANDITAEDITAIDCWDELLELPDRIGVFRARENWAARLAAMCVLKQRFIHTPSVVITGEIKCWRCLEVAILKSVGTRSKKIIMVD